MQTIPTYNFAGKKALIRVDFNVPISNGKVLDDFWFFLPFRRQIQVHNPLLWKNHKVRELFSCLKGVY
jgi:hypothetical protein